MRDAYQAAEDLLTFVVQDMTAQGVTLPTVQYVAPGSNIAYDGPQVTTNIVRIFAGNPGSQDPFEQTFVFFSVELQVVIVRNTPTLEEIGGRVKVPSTTQLKTSAQEMLADVTALTQTLINCKQRNILCSAAMPAIVGPIATEGPEGGVVATVGLFTMPLL